MAETSNPVWNGDWGKVRRKSASGRQLHCCCVCGTLAEWDGRWSYYASEKDIDDCTPYPKFCSAKCAVTAGRRAENVTQAQIHAAKCAEWRDPDPVAPPPLTDRQKFMDAVRGQRPRR